MSPAGTMPTSMGSGSETSADPSVSLLGLAGDSSLIRSSAVATFSFARVHHFAAWCEAIGPEAAGTFVPEVRQALSDPVAKLGGEIAHRRPDSLLAVFSNGPDDPKPTHAQRGLHAAILCVHETVELARRMTDRYRVSGSLPKLAITVGVHLGVAEVSRRRDSPSGRVFAMGEAVEMARGLEAAAFGLNWSVAATRGTHVASAGRTETRSSASLGLREGGVADIVEISGLLPRKGSNTPLVVFDLLRRSLAENGAAGRSAG